MKNIARIKWIASFDIEPLLSSILRIGTVLSMTLIIASLAVHQWGGEANENFGPNLQAKSIPAFIAIDLRQYGLPGFWTRFLLHLGVSGLLLTLYGRVLASLMYFAVIERSWKHAIFTAIVLVLLTLGLFTDVV